MENDAKLIRDHCKSLIGDETLNSWFENTLLASEEKFYLNFGLIGRRISKSLISTAHPIHDVLMNRKDLVPGNWSLDEVARLCLLLSLDERSNQKLISTLLGSADMREQILIYKSLPFLSNRENFTLAAVDGIRTNITAVFDAIALHNDFPFKFFSEDQWNQMVLKAIFMERPLFLIRGLDERRNKKLAQILHDFVHERWSAGRTISPELWRLVDGHVTPPIWMDILHEFNNGSHLGKQAAFNIIQQAEGWRDVMSEDQYEKLKQASKTWDEIGIQIMKGT